MLGSGLMMNMHTHAHPFSSFAVAMFYKIAVNTAIVDSSSQGKPNTRFL